ncbi:glutaminyl-peptide cyclotransferase [Dyella sp. A6]|uniref:glutaminyl-peptide cyclotransferase n=1 Tax=Dyella aluminiiresistens TaxID=3069105 RepID=UPI002E7A14AD|nr:glutaminyl-peptide cyclotransferase [Dyella sp. A6]
MKAIYALLALLVVATAPCATAHESIPVYGYTVVHAYPHDPKAYTEGLLYLHGYLYESTGQVGESTVRKVDLDTGKVLQKTSTPWPDYGEGIAVWQNRLIQLTWRSHQGFIYDLATLKPLARFPYPGEGWALTSDGSYLYMSDGTPVIRRLDPNTLKQVGSIKVTANGKPLQNINELEWVKGQIFANVWLTNRIARIDPATGKVVGWIDLTGLAPKPDTLADPVNDVLNGIAYDAKHDRLFVTGKCWPKLYQIRLTGPKRRS